MTSSNEPLAVWTMNDDQIELANIMFLTHVLSPLGLAYNNEQLAGVGLRFEGQGPEDEPIARLYDVNCPAQAGDMPHLSIAMIVYDEDMAEMIADRAETMTEVCKLGLDSRFKNVGCFAVDFQVTLVA